MQHITQNDESIISNWSNIQQICHASQVLQPQTIDEITTILTNATETTQIRTIGSAMSFEQICSVDSLHNPDQIVLDISKLNTTTTTNTNHSQSGLISLTATTATFHATTLVDDVIRILGENSLMLTISPGVIGYQTLVGAIQTGTHGQGLFQGCYGDMVESIKIILADGRYVHIDHNSNLHDPTIPPLQVAVASLGTLGIITEIEINHGPRRIFTCRKFICDYEVFLQEYQHWNESVEFVKGWWFPTTNQCQVWFVDESNENEKGLFLSLETNPNQALIELDVTANEELNETVNTYLQALYRDTGCSLSNSNEHKHSLTLNRFSDAKDVCGYLEQIVTKGIPVPQINVELAVPFSLFKQCTESLHHWSLQNAHRLHYPFIYRCTGESTRTCLYPSYGVGPIVYIGFLVYLTPDGSVRDDGMQTMYELQSLLATQYNALPHYGKHFITELFPLFNHVGLKLIAKWRKQIDPKGIFLNNTLRKFFNHIENPSIISDNNSNPTTNHVQETHSILDLITVEK